MDTSEQSEALTTVRMLSSSLLQSIDDDNSEVGVKQKKNAVIESWACEVKEAADRGEMEVEGQQSEEDTVSEIGEGIRKRIKKVPIDDGESIVSSSVAESGVDPLSNEPVLDDGVSLGNSFYDYFSKMGV